MTSQSQISVVRAFLRWSRSNIRKRGFRGAAIFFFEEVRDFVRDSTPARRRQRYGDVEFDWEYHVDTTEATISFRNRLIGVFHSAYQPTQPDAFREMISSLEIDYSQFTFIDLGSGKGRTLLMASDYPFHRVIGAELLPDLHQIALENIRKYKGGVGDRVQSLCADALDFEFPKEPTVLFLFNPFPESVFEQVITNLMQSLEKHPRAVYLIYHNPVLDYVLANRLRLIRRTDQYAIFASA